MFLLNCRVGHKFVGMGDWREDLRDIVNIANQANQADARIDYDEAYKYLEELTEGLSFEKLKKKPVVDVLKIAQADNDFIEPEDIKGVE